MKRKFTTLLTLGLLVPVALAQSIVSTSRQGAVKNGDSQFAEVRKLSRKVSAGGNVSLQKTIKQYRQAANIDAADNYADSILLYGLNYNTYNDPNQPPYGVYSFHNAPAVTFMNESGDVALPQTSTVFYAKGKYYFITTEIVDDVETGFLHIYDAETWEIVEDNINIGPLSPMFACTYDPLTDKAYLSAWGANYMKDFNSLDLNTYELKTIVTNNNYLVAMVAHPDGYIYALSANDKNLYRINKETGEFTVVGLATSRLQNGIQSMAIDWASGKVFWAGLLTDFTTHLFTIDVTTGAATEIANMPAKESILGLSVPWTEMDAPAAPTNIRFEYTGTGSLDGTLSFDAPDKTYGGEALSGRLTVLVSIDGQTEEHAVEAGEKFSLEKLLGSGRHVIAVSLENEAGRSPLRKFSTFAGTDVPSAVGNLKFELGEGKQAAVTWTAPTTSLGGGVVDESSITYRVIREPNSVVVSESQPETSFTETLSDARANYYYRVIAMANGALGGEAVSNVIASGSYYVPTFLETFESIADFELWKVIDANNDGFSWIYSDWGQDLSCIINAVSDDYLVSPKIELDNDHAYKLTFDAVGGSYDGSKSDLLDVLLCTSDEITGSETVLDSYEITGELQAGELHPSIIFQVPLSGDYYLAFHQYSVSTGGLSLDNIGVAVDAAMTAPDGVTDLTLTAGAGGALTNTFSFRAPVATYGGETLDAIDEIRIFRGDDSTEAIHVFESPRPGEQLSWTDNNLEQGIYNSCLQCVRKRPGSSRLELCRARRAKGRRQFENLNA